MGTQRNSNRVNIQNIVLYAAPLLAAAVHCCVEKETFRTLFSNGVFMVLLSSAYLLFMRTSGEKLFCRVEHHILFWGCFSLSFLLLGMHSIKYVGVLWMLIVALAAIEAGLELAVTMHIFLMVGYVILVFLSGGDLYAFAAVLLYGFIVATLFSLYRSRESTLYLAVILLAVDAVLKLVLYRLNMSFMLAHITDMLMEMAGILILVLLGYLYLRIFPGQAYTTNREISDDGQLPRGKQLEEEYFVRITEADYVLVERLREYSGELYRHSRRIAELSERAAQAVGGDAGLARAGGFYHEIGRITGQDNYIEAGEQLGRQQGFPEELLAIIRQHSPNYELPESLEAAVVMLSDCILSTSDFLIKGGMREKMADDKLVHNVFQNRLAKGNLKDSGMSVEQLEDLQEYFIEHAFEKGE